MYGIIRNQCYLFHLQSIPYHTSSIIALALDTMTLPYRKTYDVDMRDLTDNLNSLGKKVKD